MDGDTNGTVDVFVRDMQAGATRRASLGSNSAESDAISTDSAVSADGLTVALHSWATNLVSGDTNGVGDIFVRVFAP